MDVKKLNIVVRNVKKSIGKFTNTTVLTINKKKQKNYLYTKELIGLKWKK